MHVKILIDKFGLKKLVSISKALKAVETTSRLHDPTVSNLALTLTN